MKKSNPILVIPIRKHISKARGTSAIPIIKRNSNEKLVFDWQSCGLFNKTAGRKSQNRFFVREEKIDQVFIIVEQNRNYVEQVCLPHTRQKFIRVTHFKPPSCPTLSFHKRHRGQLLEDVLCLGVMTSRNVDASAASWNLYPSRYFQADFYGSVSYDHDGRVLPLSFAHGEDELLDVSVHSRNFDKTLNNNNALDNNSCTSQKSKSTIYKKVCILQSDSIANILNNLNDLKKEKLN